MLLTGDRVELLFLTGDTGSVGSILLPEPQVFAEKSRPENLGSQPIFFSPTLRYAGGADFCPKHRSVFLGMIHKGLLVQYVHTLACLHTSM